MFEQQIADGCRNGDNAARREMYERFGSRLYNICRRYVADSYAAEDVLHDAFIKIYSSFDRFEWRGEGSLRAWAERVTVNMALEYIRKKSKLSFSPVSDLNAQSDDAVVPADSVRAVPQEILARFINELPDGYRTVFNLYCMDGYSHGEIAAMLGINEKSSSSQLSRAKAVLAARIKDYLKAESLT